MSRIVFCILIALVCSYPQPTESARILGFFPVPSKSHLIIQSSIANALAEAGNEVIVISNFANVIKNAKYKFIHIDFKLDKSITDLNSINNPKPWYAQFSENLDFFGNLANKSLSHPIMQNFLYENQQGSFDLVVSEYIINDIFLGLAAHFKCPIIITAAVRPMLPLESYIGNPPEYSYAPLFMSDYDQPMTFFQRIGNTLFAMIVKYLIHPKLNAISEKYYNYHFPADRYPSLDEMRKNVSLVLTNHHFSQGPIRPNVPALIEIGGIQIKEKPNPLPQDLENIMNNAKNGIIFFSLGSIVQGSVLIKEKAKIMFSVLSKLPYTILWKWDQSEFPGTSPNIIYRSWLPQDDILAHPNLKLFITHGGQGSVVESQFHGVPMVGIPLFGDQPTNMANVVRSGFGVSLSYIDLTEEGFSKGIDEVLHNPKYTDAVKRFSRLYRDRPMTARQSVVYWVEYVIRHKGAKHLQSPAVHMNSFQLMSLDVIGFLTAILGIIVFVLVKICKLICCRSKHGNEKVTPSKKNK